MVKLSSAAKRYGDFCLDVSLELPEGRVTGLIGRNGAGKSTAIKSVLGLIKLDSGSAEVFGKDAKKLAPSDKEKIGAALSDSGFSVYLTPGDVMQVMKSMYSRFDASAFAANCERQGLATDKLIKEYSTGMKAKLKVLLAVSHGADLLILDEPTAGLDVEARHEILDMLRAYLAEDPKRSMLISSHISTDLEGICDDICLIDGGKVILREDTDVILGNYGVIKADRETAKALSKEHILAEKEESFGYSLLTDDRQYFAEKHPGLSIENAGIDDVILMLAGGRE